MAEFEHGKSFDSNVNRKKQSLGGNIGSKWKKYPLGSDVDKEEVFDFPYIVHEDTVSFIQEHGRIMFIIRGPPSTGKATLSDMILKKYPNSSYCCADRYFNRSFPNERTRESIKESHEYCQKKAEAACLNNQSPIIIQNTHIRKWEMQYYLDLAAVHNYTIIMAVTLYKFDVTLEALEKNNTDGLTLEYFKGRMRKWSDVMPNFTGWFLCPQDSYYLLYSVREIFEALLGDGKFCSVFDAYNIDDIFARFKARRLLFCLAKHSKYFHEMKKYYLSDTVQESYGKMFEITVKGYLISSSSIVGITEVSQEMEPLIMKNNDDELDIPVHALRIDNNICEYSKSIPFEKSSEVSKTAILNDWDDGEDISLCSCNFIDIAHNDDTLFDFPKLQQQLTDAALLMKDERTQSVELENGVLSYRLPNNEWLVKAPQKITFKSIFTGLYT
ncbi:2',3'-cyclic-nucleotide 3'-phosphodiesterase-like [Uloborus diversus]|uniref:2',3'-cyclic-nucleotide 3'-phosphodiesterase-like n=1 Tax=Uloborus diversus TaxID=327109 RepID=UPI002409C342|nr:2',3'-cyclic-nucleotide 3'-phosphodiesterase-like [Uloborus diversus]